MPKTQRQQEGAAQFKVKEPSMYDVIMLNDDVTTMDFVVRVLMRVFHKSKEIAQSLMMKIHLEGSAVVGTYSKDIAQSKAQLTMQLAKAEGFPLKVTVKEK
jgi:ATP-dependent Clp protease adaptor protein ClpS